MSKYKIDADAREQLPDGDEKLEELLDSAWEQTRADGQTRYFFIKDNGGVETSPNMIKTTKQLFSVTNTKRVSLV